MNLLHVALAAHRTQSASLLSYSNQVLAEVPEQLELVVLPEVLEQLLPVVQEQLEEELAVTPEVQVLAEVQVEQVLPGEVQVLPE